MMNISSQFLNGICTNFSNTKLNFILRKEETLKIIHIKKKECPKKVNLKFFDIKIQFYIVKH